MTPLVYGTRDNFRLSRLYLSDRIPEQACPGWAKHARAPARGSGALAHRGLSGHAANDRTLGSDRGEPKTLVKIPVPLFQHLTESE
jgi:hypothetical protein